MTEFYNRREMAERRQELRTAMPPSERILWQHLKNKQLEGHKFRRQYSIGVYVVDFYCPVLKLAIEVDGSTHEGEEAGIRDAERQQYIEAFGIHFLRFTNAQVQTDHHAVLTAISQAVAERKAGSDLPPARNDLPPPPPY